VDFWNENGYLVLENVVDFDELQRYRTLTDKLLSGEIASGTLRSDLGEG